MPAADAAAQWFVRLQDGGAGAEDWLAFEAWLAASPAHAAAYERLEHLWVELDESAGAVTGALDAPVSLEAHRTARRGRAGVSRRGWVIGGAALAASLAIAIVGPGLLPRVLTTSYSTPPGQTRELTLADGTHVWLNASSRIDVSFPRHRRRVEMADGEAVFDVTHDPDRPFVISTGQRDVRVVGTQFNLRQREGEFALTVRRGVVEVRPSKAPDAAPTRVAAGQRLTHKPGAPAILTAAASDAAFAWTNGQLVYSDAPLAEVAADLSRSLGVPVRPADAATGRLRFTGVLGLDDKAAVLRRLEAFAGVRAERSDGAVVLRRGQPHPAS
jgi:transmembrane sensor